MTTGFLTADELGRLTGTKPKDGQFTARQRRQIKAQLDKRGYVYEETHNDILVTWDHVNSHLGSARGKDEPNFAARFNVA